MSQADLTRPGVWTELFPHALGLMRHLEKETVKPIWTFGGGTVLMLRLNHRQSKDIDLFVPDPQYLGFVNPRLSDVAEAITTEYEESAEYIKLMLPAGEIDIVVGTSLTPRPFEIVDYCGQLIRVETNAEIIAKKLWHRGDRCRARDLFDLCAVAKADPAAMTDVAPFAARHGERFLAVLHDREALLRKEFEAIDALNFRDSFDQCAQVGRRLIGFALGRHDLLDDGTVHAGHFVGAILSIEDGVVAQRTSAGGEVAHHCLAALTQSVAVGDVIEVHYQAGIGSVCDLGQQRGLVNGR